MRGARTAPVGTPKTTSSTPHPEAVLSPTVKAHTYDTEALLSHMVEKAACAYHEESPVGQVAEHQVAVVHPLRRIACI